MKIWAAVLLLVSAGGALAADQSPSFCARLAPQLGLKKTDQSAVYHGQLISGLKAALVGGSASIAFGVESVGHPSPDDAAALRHACTVAKAEYRCVIDRPMALLVSSTKGDGRVEAQAGEKALVTTKGMRVRCADEVTG
ncbi:hypothetical protein F1C10_07310 [Sphingomonas sp. NBWT7]|uniref:hypothetical protein n=1 Tax=Sphingomonas sp. NBWT7 TaxID=2596913 RepID=UPI001624A671|nr:hypothetical protein [Sphingomonas sp. NBWT7]QNE31761.1 hypothetical protein F1C10_07310 [Sphingomonas sp. NBWT7]